MRNVTIVAVLVLVCGYVVSHAAKRDNAAIERLAGHTPIRNIPIGKNFEAGALFAQNMSNRCVTPVVYCYLAQYAPVGTACWCATPNGPVGGTIR